MEEKKFNFPKTFLLGFGFFGVSVIWSVYNAFVPLILDGKFGLSAGWVGFVMVLDNVAALFIQPPLGVLSDRTRTPIGRRLPYIVIGAPLAAGAFGLIPAAATLPLFLLGCITLLLAMAIWRTPVVALMPDITPSKYRSQANGVINLMGGLGTVLATLIGAPLYRQNPAYAFMLGSGLVVVSAILVLIFIREPKEFRSKKIHLAEHVSVNPGQRQHVMKDIQEVFSQKDKSAMYILLAILFWFISYNAIETFLSLYGVKYLGLDAADSSFQFSYIGLIFMLAAIPAGVVAAKAGRKRTIMIGIVIMILCIIAMFVFPVGILTTKLAGLMGNGLYIYSLFLMVAGIGWAFINVNSLPMVVDMTDDEHVGTYTGLYYFFSQIAATLGPFMFGWLIEAAGNNYQVMMVIGPVFLVLAFIMMLNVKKGEIKTEEVSTTTEEGRII
ncbi:MAG: SLC45 family MFS transporter [Anaerolineaceae bacterium]|nr:SLC45 family MFS transporter [Anaerolineaceae bacterium]